MADSRPVPCNLLSWPRVADLLPDQKLIFGYFWFNRFTNAAGCYQFPVAMAARELGLSEAALLEALSDFMRRELILYDSKTSEIFLLDWYRFHKFNTTSQIRQLEIAVLKIESEDLNNSVLNKIKCLQSNRNSNGNSNKSLARKSAPCHKGVKPPVTAATPSQLARLFERIPQLERLVT